NPTGRDARLVVFFADRPDVQYGRDVRVPGRSLLSTDMLLGPAPDQPVVPRSRDLQLLLFDRTGGQERLLLPPGEQLVRSHTLPSRRPVPLTCLLLDLPRGAAESDAFDQPDSVASQVLRLVRLFREMRSLSGHVEVVRDRFLPGAAEALDGVDHVVLAGRRLA